MTACGLLGGPATSAFAPLAKLLLATGGHSHWMALAFMLGRAANPFQRTLAGVTAKPSSRNQLPKPVNFVTGLFQLIGGLIQEASVEISGRTGCQTGILSDLSSPCSKSVGYSAHLLNVYHRGCNSCFRSGKQRRVHGTRMVLPICFGSGGAN